MLIKCPECGHQVSDQAKTCPSCGIEIAGKLTRCPDCGEIIFKEQSHCPNCHRIINEASASSVAQAVSPVIKEKQTPKQQESVPVPRRPRKKRLGLMALIIAFVIALIVVFLGIYFMKSQEEQNEQRAFQNAMLSTEPLVLQNFLDMYADAPLHHRDSVKVHLNALKKIDTDWANALVNNSKFGFERFIKMHPENVHNVEARIKIDSLDWAEANKTNTAEGFLKYMNEHSDGTYYDEAKNNYERLDAQKITAEDRQMVSQLFTAYFNALAVSDEAALSATLAPVLSSFLHRSNATREDVRQYMHKLHEDDITSMTFTPSDNWTIEKRLLDDGRYNYKVDFSVVQNIERTDESRERKAVFKVTAQVSPEGRISELNMKRNVQ